MADNTPLIPTEPDWDGTPLSRTEEILYSIIHSEEWDGTPLSRGEYLLLQVKDAIENNSMLDFKGRVDSVNDLPSTGNKKGDVYSVGPESQLNRPEYFWTGTSWEYLGQIVDLSGYLPLTGGTMTGMLKLPTIGLYDGARKLDMGLLGDTWDISTNSTQGDILLDASTNGSDCVRVRHGSSAVPSTDSSDKVATTEIVNSIINRKYCSYVEENQARTSRSTDIFNQKSVSNKYAESHVSTTTWVDGSSEHFTNVTLWTHAYDENTTQVARLVVGTNLYDSHGQVENGISLGVGTDLSHMNCATYNGTDLTVNNVAILSTLSSIQTTIGNINTVLEEVL